MRNFRLSSFLILGLTVLVACGGSGGSTSLSLEEYLQTVVDKEAETEQLVDALDAEFDVALETASDAEAVELYRGLLAEQADLAKGYLADLQRLEPPSVAGDAAVEYVLAFEALLAAVDATIGGTEGATTIAEVDEVFIETMTPGVFRVEAACLTLQQIADDNEVVIDLECSV